ncbi:XdhC/CoxI family protein [bacterium]|nr:XdhC/CoxI family protein [bacterium]
MRIDQEALHRRIATLLDLRKHFVVATILETKGSCPQQSGAKIIVRSDGSFEFTIGGGTFEAEVIQDSLAFLKSDSPQTRDYKLTKSELGMYCQGLVKVFFEKYAPRPQLLIFGGGHVGQALSRIGAATELFSVVVVDDRKEYASRKKHPAADRIILTDRNFTKKIPQVDEETYIVILTRCHATDKLLVQKYADSKTAYVGLIGSQAKIRQFARELQQEEGMQAKTFERIHAPVGLQIGGKNPSEIAISILAEVLLVKNSKRLERSLDFKKA